MKARISHWTLPRPRCQMSTVGNLPGPYVALGALVLVAIPLGLGGNPAWSESPVRRCVRTSVCTPVYLLCPPPPPYTYIHPHNAGNRQGGNALHAGVWDMLVAVPRHHGLVGRRKGWLRPWQRGRDGPDCNGEDIGQPPSVVGGAVAERLVSPESTERV